MKTLFKKHARTLSTIIIIILFTTSLWQLATAGWIQGKAIMAQHLLDQSWQRTMKDNSSQAHKPWPWADTWPAAKLIVPKYDIEQIVLAGDSGNSLAFAPGYSFAGSVPNTTGTTVISGHRDTHFRFLKQLQLNDILYLQTNGITITYQVNKIRIVNRKTFQLYADHSEKKLILVTCYPFDSVTAGGDLRYLVYTSQIA